MVKFLRWLFKPHRPTEAKKVNTATPPVRVTAKLVRDGNTTGTSTNPSFSEKEQAEPGGAPIDQTEDLVKPDRTVAPQGQKDIQRLTIGLDFGTAFSKVVIRGLTAHLIPLRDGRTALDDYLLPTELWVTKSGFCSLTATSDAKRYQDLKKRILENKVDECARIRIIAYLALLLRRVRQWIIIEKQDIYHNRELNWFINIGLPTEIHKKKQLESLYKESVYLAWLLSGGEDQISQEAIQKAIVASTIPETTGAAKGFSIEKIQAFPEFVAQVTGYTASPQRVPGAHVLVDVGAGTVDSTVFIVHRHDDEDIHPILEGTVSFKGVFYLLEARIENTNYGGAWLPDYDTPIPSRAHFASHMQINEALLKQAEKPLKDEVYVQVSGDVKKARYDKTPNSKLNWTDGVPIFLTGGGSHIEFYKEIISELQKLWRSQLTEHQGIRLDIKPLPPPTHMDSIDLKNIPKESWHRFSVAYGLSFNALDIGEITSLPTGTIQRPVKTKCPICFGSGGGSLTGCAKCSGTGWA